MGDMFCANGSNTKYIDHLPRYVLEPFKWHLINASLQLLFNIYLNIKKQRKAPTTFRDNAHLIYDSVCNRSQYVSKSPLV